MKYKGKKRVWRTLSSKSVYKNSWINVREDKVVRPDGKHGIYAVLDKAPVVMVIAKDSKGYFYLLKQHRYPINKYLVEFPAGIMETKNIISNAKRELKEELGITAKKWKVIGKFYPACSNASMLFYATLAEDLDTTGLVAGGEGDELITETIKLKEKELKKYIHSGKLQCGPSLAALTLLSF